MPDIKAQNEKALASVKSIYDAAEQAKSDASRAKDAADDAVDAAELADEKAGEAKISALAAGKAPAMPIPVPSLRMLFYVFTVFYPANIFSRS